MLSPEERRRFRRLEHGLRVMDPAWLARHHPRRRRYADLARLVVAMLAAGLVSGGAVAGAMPVVCCGILLGMGAATSFVSSRSTTGNVQEGDGWPCTFEHCLSTPIRPTAADCASPSPPTTSG